MSTTPYFPPSYFPGAYFGAYFQTAPPPSPVEPDPESAEHESAEHVGLRLIVDKLRATLAFHDVVLNGPPDSTECLGMVPPSVAVVPRGWEETEDLDPDVALRTVEFDLILTSARTDPELRVEELNRLARIASASLRGAALGGRSVPALTRILKESYGEKGRHPENEIRLKGRFAFLAGRED